LLPEYSLVLLQPVYYSFTVKESLDALALKQLVLQALTYLPLLLLPTLIPLSGSVQHVFIMLDSAIIFTTGRLPEVNPP
jgi:hypothetical protein